MNVEMNINTEALNFLMIEKYLIQLIAILDQLNVNYFIFFFSFINFEKKGVRCNRAQLNYWSLIQSNYVCSILNCVASIQRTIYIHPKFDFMMILRLVLIVRETENGSSILIRALLRSPDIFKLLLKRDCSSYALIRIRWLPQELRLKILNLCC